jgi:hypothetical protein
MHPGEAQRKLETLETLVTRETAALAPHPTTHWVNRFRAMPGVAAVLFYGSGLRDQAHDPDVVYDFYLLVHRYRDYAPGWFLAAGGSLVPPNVYYFEETVGSNRQRCKVAVLTVSQFCLHADDKALTPHIWARFCQPCRILFTESVELRTTLNEALVNCVVAFHRQTLHQVDSCSIGDFWSTGLRSTYADEIRSEKRTRGRSIYTANVEACRARTRLALLRLPEIGRLDDLGIVSSKIPPDRRNAYRRRLRLMRPVKKAVVVLRLLKAGFSFRGGLDYARWKVERHSGIRVEINDFQRRHPVLGGIVLFLKAVRLGTLR